MMHHWKDLLVPHIGVRGDRFPDKSITMRVLRCPQIFANTWLWPGTSHGGSANLLCCDGHVESSRQTNWISAMDTARRRWNNDGEPHHETWETP